MSKVKWEIKSYVQKNYVMQRATNNLLLIINVFYYKGKINLVEFYFVEKGGSTGKRRVQTSSACEPS
jgi:hypothetical protein